MFLFVLPMKIWKRNTLKSKIEEILPYCPNSPKLQTNIGNLAEDSCLNSYSKCISCSPHAFHEKPVFLLFLICMYFVFRFCSTYIFFSQISVMITFVKVPSFKNVLWVLDTLDTWTIWITGYFLWDQRIISLNKPKCDN